MTEDKQMFFELHMKQHPVLHLKSGIRTRLTIICLVKDAILGLFFFIFIFSMQLTVGKQMFYIKVCR